MQFQIYIPIILAMMFLAAPCQLMSQGLNYKELFQQAGWLPGAITQILAPVEELNVESYSKEIIKLDGKNTRLTSLVIPDQKTIWVGFSREKYVLMGQQIWGINWFMGQSLMLSGITHTNIDNTEKFRKVLTETENLARKDPAALIHTRQFRGAFQIPGAVADTVSSRTMGKVQFVESNLEITLTSRDCAAVITIDDKLDYIKSTANGVVVPPEAVDVQPLRRQSDSKPVPKPSSTQPSPFLESKTQNASPLPLGLPSSEQPKSATIPSKLERRNNLTGENLGINTLPSTNKWGWMAWFIGALAGTGFLWMLLRKLSR